MSIRDRGEQTLRGTIACFAMVALLPVIAVAQAPEERIDAAMARALEAGIPVSLLESKQAEGRAKGIPMDRIAAAVETRLQHLEAARQAMELGADDVDADQLSVGADAIGAGVSQVVLEAIAASAAGEERSVAVAALTYLVSEGLASEIALERVTRALEQGPPGLAGLTVPGAGERPDGGPPEGIPPFGNAGALGRGAGGPPASVPAPGQVELPVAPGRGGPPEGVGVPDTLPGGPPAGIPQGGQP